MVRPHLVESSYCKFGATERHVKLNPFPTHTKMFFNSCCYMKKNFKDTETYKYF